MSTTGNLDGHLGEGTEIDGTLQFKGSVRIDGKFTGKVFSPSTLILGPRAALQGEVEVGELAVHGSLSGQVRAAERVTIHASGRVEADLNTDKLVIEPGAYFRGRCEMHRSKSASPASAATQAAATVLEEVPSNPSSDPKKDT
jgi:cytoskeletal protein CcmA (bactofilin family)